MTAPVRPSVIADVPDEQVCMLVLTGELDHTNAEQLRGEVLQLFEPHHRHLLLDLTGLSFCDSTGIRIFLAMRQLARQRDGVITLAALNARLTKIFQMTGLTGAFAVHPTRAEALAALTGPPD